MKAVPTKLLSLFVTITLLLSCEHKVSIESPQEVPVSFVQNTDRLDVSKAQFWFEQSVNQPSKAARTIVLKGPSKKRIGKQLCRCFLPSGAVFASAYFV